MQQGRRRQLHCGLPQLCDFGCEFTNPKIVFACELAKRHWQEERGDFSDTMHGPWGSWVERNDLGRRSMRQTSFAAFKLSVQFKARSRFRARYDYCRSAFFYRHRSDATGGRSFGRASALFLRVSGSRVGSAVAACQRNRIQTLRAGIYTLRNAS